MENNGTTATKVTELGIALRCLGDLGTNVYFAVNKNTRETLLIDPADNASYIMEQAKLRDYRIVAILLTHGHFDHIGAVERLRDALKIPVYANEDERQFISDPKLNRSSAWSPAPFAVTPDIFLRDGQEIWLAGFRVRMLHTPGHTPGSCCYYLPDFNVLFSGDTLFYCSYGRTDLGGSQDALARSIRDVLFALPDGTKVYPGHMEPTTIGFEKEHNPIALDYIT